MSIRIKEEKDKLIKEIDNLMRSVVDLRMSITDQVELSKDQLQPALDDKINEKINRMYFYQKLRAYYYNKNDEDLMIPYNLNFDWDLPITLDIPSWDSISVKILDLLNYSNIDLADYSQYYLTTNKESGLLLNYLDNLDAYIEPKITNNKIIANEYDSSRQYIYAMSVIHNNLYYYCVNTTTGEFDETSWVQYDGNIIKGDNEYKVSFPISNSINNINIIINNIIVAVVVNDKLLNVNGNYFNEDNSFCDFTKNILNVVFNENAFLNLESFNVNYTSINKVVNTGVQSRYYYYPSVDGYSDVNFYVNDEMLSSEDISYTEKTDSNNTPYIEINLLSDKAKNSELFISLVNKVEIDILMASNYYVYESVFNSKNFKVSLQMLDTTLIDVIVVNNNTITYTNNNYVQNVNYENNIISIELSELSMVTANTIIYDYNTAENIDEWKLTYNQIDLTLTDGEYDTKIFNPVDMSSDEIRPKWQDIYPIRDIDTHEIVAVLFVTITNLESINGWRFYFIRTENSINWNSLTDTSEAFFKMSTDEMKEKLALTFNDDNSDIIKSLNNISTFDEPENNPFYPMLGSNDYFTAENTSSPFRGNFVAVSFDGKAQYVINSDLKWSWGVKPLLSAGVAINETNKDQFVNEDLSESIFYRDNIDVIKEFSSANPINGFSPLGTFKLNGLIIEECITTGEGGDSGDSITVCTTYPSWWNDYLVTCYPACRGLIEILNKMLISSETYSIVDEDQANFDIDFTEYIQNLGLIEALQELINYDATFINTFPTNRNSYTYNINYFNNVIFILNNDANDLSTIVNRNNGRIEALMTEYSNSIYDWVNKAVNTDSSSYKKALIALNDINIISDLINNKREIYGRY